VIYKRRGLKRGFILELWSKKIKKLLGKYRKLDRRWLKMNRDEILKELKEDKGEAVTLSTINKG